MKAITGSPTAKSTTPGAQGAYDPRNFAAQSTRVARIHAERVEDIAEIEPRSADIDLHLTAARRPAALSDQPEIVEVAAGFDADDLPLRNLRLGRFGEGLESLGKCRTVTYRHLDLGAHQAGDKISRLGGVDRRPRIEIEFGNWALRAARRRACAQNR